MKTATMRCGEPGRRAKGNAASWAGFGVGCASPVGCRRILWPLAKKQSGICSAPVFRGPFRVDVERLWPVPGRGGKTLLVPQSKNAKRPPEPDTLLECGDTRPETSKRSVASRGAVRRFVFGVADRRRGGSIAIAMHRPCGGVPGPRVAGLLPGGAGAE